MSDLYDSLEDECDEVSCHSSDKLKTNFLNEGAVKFGWTSEGHEPFFLDQKEKSGGHNIEVPNGQATAITDLVSKSCCQINSFLPKVVDEVKRCGSNSASLNLAAENEDLGKKGLQLNKDGSFTKSPRLETEQLPFVNPEYKNVQFRKVKPELRGKSRFSKKNRKNIFTFKENSKDEISMIDIIKLREAKGSSEEILTSDGSLLSFKEIPFKSGENFRVDNLTDSMKEMMMLKQNESITERGNNKSSEQYKKSRRSVSISRNSKNSKSKRYSNKSNLKETSSHVSGEKQNDCEPNLDRRMSQKKKLPQIDEGVAKSSNPVVKKRSDILLNFSKPRLSYFERRQKESGFNPLYLRYGVKRVPSDTNRSNFGDSVAEKLSEMSSGVVSCRGITDDEDEELFYRKLIEKEKSKQWEENRTCRSERHKEKEKCVHLCSSNSCRNQKELKRSDKFYSRQKLKKSTSIDMPTATATSPMNPAKKYSHYCSVNVTSSLSKTELALKARAYGYMANARNIFKMKTQSEGKVASFESELSGKRNSKKVINEDASIRANESSEDVERGFRMTSKRLPRTSRSLCKAEKYNSVAGKEIVLPPVCRSETKNLEFKSEVLKQVQCCLSGGANQSSGYVELNNVYGNVKHLRGKYAESLPPFKCVP